jgi:glyceraldehyde-3-phosphate dehydrogenase (NADP+)
VGNHIRKVSNGIPLLLELGGKDIGIVTNNADLKVAADQVVSGCFSYGGQRCTAQKIAYVYPEVADKFVEMARAKAQVLTASPMIDQEAADFVASLIDDAKVKGAKEVLIASRDRNYMGASVLDNVTEDMRVFSEEQFGPILPIVRVSGEDEAIAKANASRYGLQASVYSQDIDEAFRIADKLNVGTVQINARPDRGPDNFPFGGVKDSGQLMQGTIETLELMTRGKLTVLNLKTT